MDGGIRSRLASALESAVRELGVTQVPDLELGRAKNPAHGDYASSAGLKLARELRQAPLQIASSLAGTIRIADGAATAEPAAPGYVNFRLTPEWLQQLVAQVAARGPGYGAADISRDERLQVEFLSVNRTWEGRHPR